MDNTLIEEVTSSKSLKVLRTVNKKLPKKFHEHTHILYDIRTLFGDKEITYLEIGSYIGSSASLILRHEYPSNIICIDPLNLNKKDYNGSKGQPNTLKDVLEENNIYERVVNVYKKYSNDKKLLEKMKDVKIDILFVDGGNTYKDIINDWNNYNPLVNTGGFIIFNNYLDNNTPDIKLAVDHIVKSLPENIFKVIGSIPNIQSALPIIHEDNNMFIIYKHC